MKNHFLGNLPKFHLWIDVFLLNASFLAAGFVSIEGFTAFGDHQNLNLLLVSNVIWILCFSAFGLYRFTSATYNSFNQIGRVLTTYNVHLILIELYVYFNGEKVGMKEHLVFLAFEIFALGSLMVRMAITFLIRHFKKSGYNLNRYAVIGNGGSRKWLNRFKEDLNENGYRFCGMHQLKDDSTHLASLENLMEREKLDFLYCCLSELSHEQLSGVLKLAERKKTQIRLIPDFHSLQMKKVNFDPLETYPAFHLSGKPLSNPGKRVIKRAFDVAFSLFVMLAGLPVFMILILLVKLSSRGPVFLRQTRTGRWGETFGMLRFRTHHLGSYSNGREPSSGEPEFTIIGSFLKTSRLDDLPRFLNVLKGEMSIVGPQPLRETEVDMLQKDASHDLQKVLTIKPGLTSIGQIKVGYATNLTESLHRLRYDMLYLNSYSWTKDLYLIYLTIQVFLIGKAK